MEHRQAQNREYDSGHDELLPRAWTRSPAFIGASRVCCSTTTRETNSAHIACELRHPTQLLGEGEFAREMSRFDRGARPLESIGKIGTGEHHVGGCDEEYPIAAPEDVVFSGAPQRILRVTAEQEREEADERRYPWKSTRGWIVNEEESDLDEGVKCKRKPLHSSRVGYPACECGGDLKFNHRMLNFSPTP